ncbi:hypothetical protein WJU23_02230 [Prosthecobacter sp. SYSU 5D2]|uniref:hypothetical protein n=1 Tax=Prosthecobacter sp. SYSU 5D2 TaxID=3134134 RepID=UPI0031FE86A7
MKELARTIQSIRAALQDGNVTPSAEKAARDYAQHCTQADQRLEQVALMLQKGSDYQALQAAEQEPPLLDLVAALSFGEEKAWREFCETHELPVAPELSAQTVQSLEKIYAKGITANHPLYKDFRAAVLARDDAKSLQIINVILKLNPKDANAKSELQRLLNKNYQETVEKLRSLLKTDDEQTISRLTEKLATLATKDKLQREETYVQAESIRRSWRARQASERLPLMIRQMQEHHDREDWRAVGEMVEDITALMTEHAIEPADEGQKLALDTLTHYHQKKLAEDELRRNFERSLRGFLAFVDEVEARLLTGAGMSYAELSQKDETFVRQWKEIEGYRLPVPNETLQRITRAGQELRTRLRGVQRARRVRLWMSAAAAVLLLAGVASLALHSWKAQTLSGELADHMTRQTSLPAEELIRQLRENEPLLMRWPFLQARVEEVDAWAKQGRGLEQRANATLDSLEGSFQGETTSLAPGQLVGGLEDLSNLIKQMPVDLASEARNRLAVLRTRSDLHLATLAKTYGTDTASAVSALEEEISQALVFDRPVAQTAENVKRLDARLAVLEAALNPDVESLRLPADLETRILGLRQRVAAFQGELDAFARVREQTAEADSLAQYAKALADWQDIRFTEAAPASVVLDVMPDETAFLATLITGGNVEALKAVREDVSTIHMAPAQPMERDLRILLELRDDPFLNNVWENNVADFSRRRSDKTYWSSGKLEEVVIGDARRWKGRSFDSAESAGSVSYIDREFRQVTFSNGGKGGEGVVSSRLSATSELMNLLQLNRMTDPDGDRFLRSLLEAMEKVMNDSKASPLAKAFLMQRLEDMASTRPLAWGFHLSPSLQADLAALRAVLGDTVLRSEDWMLPSMRTRFSGPLGDFFQKAGRRVYLKEAKARRELLMAVAEAGVKFGGYVETDFSLRLKNNALGAPELWVLSASGAKPMLMARPAANASPFMAADAQPLSPVFIIPVDRAALTAAYEKALTGSGSARTPAAGEALFLAPPQP